MPSVGDLSARPTDEGKRVSSLKPFPGRDSPKRAPKLFTLPPVPVGVFSFVSSRQMIIDISRSFSNRADTQGTSAALQSLSVVY